MTAGVASTVSEKSWANPSTETPHVATRAQRTVLTKRERIMRMKIKPELWSSKIVIISVKPQTLYTEIRLWRLEVSHKSSCDILKNCGPHERLYVATFWEL